MAKTRSRINTLYVGLTNPPTTKVLSKKDLKVDGPKQVRDDTTTDDSAGPEHAVIFAGDIAGVDFTVLMDSADTSYLLLRDAAKAGTIIYASYRAVGDGTGKEEAIFACTVDMTPDHSTMAMARAAVKLVKTGGVTYQNQP